jgi:hypothetical protein
VSDYTAAIKRVGTGQVNVWGEGATASCGGVDGISNTFASALWNVDMLFEFATRGVQLAIFSGTPQAIYAPLIMARPSSTVNVQPSFYGMLFFNIALGGLNSRVYGPRVSGAPSARYKAWASYDEVANVYTLVILHKDPGGSPLPVTVTSPIAGGYGQMILMTAPAMESTTGETLAGMSIDGTNGDLAGTYASTFLQADGEGRFTLTVPKSSAAILRITATKVTDPLFTTLNLRNFQVAGTINNASTNARNIPRQRASADPAPRPTTPASVAWAAVGAVLLALGLWA